MNQPIEHRRTLRRSTRLAALVAIGLLATACGSDDEATSTTADTTVVTSADTTADSTTDSTTEATTGDTTATTAGGTGAESGAFPVSIESKFGTAEIESQPERVVTIGYTDGDYVLALGVTPIAIRDWYGDQPGGLWPWAADSDAASDDIEVLASDQIDFESIAAADPDVIIAIGSEIEQTEYDTLSEIAPVVAQSDEYIQFGTPWDVFQLTVGRALGLEDEAQAIVDDVTAQIETAAADHPSWAGLTANFAVLSTDGSSFAYTENDNRGRLLTQLGFTIPEAVTELAGDLFYAQVSAEQIGLVDADLLLYNTFSADDRAAVDALPLFTGLPVVGAGHAVYVDADQTGAMSFATTLSIPYALDAIVPAIDAALGVAAATTTAGIVAGEDADVDAVVAAYTAVFDSTTTFDEKAPYLPEAESVRATIDNYVVAGDAVGGILLTPTAVTIDGDTAAVTYDVLFAGTPVYTALSGTAVRVDGTWTVTKDEFCGFMSSARNPCP